MAAGLDSLGAVELRDALAGRFGVDLPATAVLDAGTPAALTAVIAAALAVGGGGVTETDKHVAEVDIERESELEVEVEMDAVVVAEEVTSVAAPTTSLPTPPPHQLAVLPSIPAPAPTGSTAALILAASWRLPGGPSPTATRTLASLAASLGDAAGPTPAGRWDADALYSPPPAPASSPSPAGTIYARFAAYLPDLAAFDRGAFGFGAAEAGATDPQARLLLEEAAAALGGVGGVAGMMVTAATTTTTTAATPSPPGVYVGCMHHDYGDTLARTGAGLSAAAATGSGGAFMAGRCAYAFGMGGPCVAVDTACSASLVAAHLGRAGLAAGEAGAALVGGVNALTSPTTAAAICALQALSPVTRRVQRALPSARTAGPPA